MKKLSLPLLLLQAEEYCNLNIRWHHHFLPVKCLLNGQKGFRIVLENERDGTVFYAVTTTKPLISLKKLEQLFFRQK